VRVYDQENDGTVINTFFSTTPLTWEEEDNVAMEYELALRYYDGTSELLNRKR